MDQFRGFTVLSMFIVNFMHMDTVNPFWKHNDNYVSFADWIMPGFIFAVGFSYRLTILKRLEKMGSWATYSTYFRRSLALILVSLMMYGVGGSFKTWDSFSADAAIKVLGADGKLVDGSVNATVHWLMKLIKSNLWEVLAIIGVAQIFVMPVIARSFLLRFFTMLCCLVGHVLISGWFNWGFVHGDESNWMVQLWHTGGNSSWDGGFFGIISWSVAMLAGSLVYDILASNSRGKAGGKIFLFAVVFMLIGYVLSCGTRFYDIPLKAPTIEKTEGMTEAEHKAAKEAAAKKRKKLAENPMWPDFSTAKGRDWRDLLAEPPFVMPPHPDQQSYIDAAERVEVLKVEIEAEQIAAAKKAAKEANTDEKKEEDKKKPIKEQELEKLQAKLLGAPMYDHARQWNYWMMYKRVVSVPFILFATGVAIALYAIFILLSDLGSMHVGVFRTFGLNPLAAYVLHSMIGRTMHAFAPDNAPALYCWFITGVFMFITYVFVRHLEKHKIFVRL
jgi:hypothetical protein